VTALGRWVAAGSTSTGSHALAIFYPDPVTGRGIQMFGTGGYDGSGNPLYAPPWSSGIILNTTGKPTGQFSYVPLSSDVILWPGQTYYITSYEAGGGAGDVWLDNTTTVTTTGDAVLATAAYFDPSNSFLVDYGGAGGNHPIVPVDFRYSVGTPGANVTTLGSPFFTGPNNDVVLNMFRPAPTARLVSGSSVLAHGVWGGGPAVGETLTYQWRIWDSSGNIEMTSPVLQETNTSGSSLPWTFDSTLLTDGTKVLYPRILDATVSNLFTFQSQGQTTVVANSGHSEAAQNVPITVMSPGRWASPRADIVHYDGVPNPIHNTYATPYTTVPGSNDAMYRNPGNYYFAVIVGTHAAEYHEINQWSTNDPPNGVMATGTDALCEDAHKAIDAYDPVIKLNPSDGTRLNNILSPFTTYIEDPSTSGVWWFVELSGRLGFVDRSGTVTTVAGFRRDKSKLTYPQDSANPDNQEADNFETVGSFPPDVDMGGANDLCFDPRDTGHNTIYVACQVDNWIAKIDKTGFPRTPATVTVYAGLPGAPNGYVDDPSPLNARFAEPNSLIMDGSGNLYVSDMRNSAIRKIASPSLGAAGAVTTAFGGNTWSGWAGHGSTPLTGADVSAAAATFNVTSIIWNNGTMTGAVTMSGGSTTIQLGYTLQLSGAINTGGSGDPNVVYVVTAFTSSTSFTVGFQKSSQNVPSSIGTLSGSMTFSYSGMDVYSAPLAVGVTTTGGQIVLPATVRITAAGNLIVFESCSYCARIININTGDGGSVGTIRRIGIAGNRLGVNSEPVWTWGEVDSAGVCGPVNDCLYWTFQGPVDAAHSVWRTSFDVDSAGQPNYGAIFFTDTSILSTWGPHRTVRQGQGHYPWAVGISKLEGKMISTGTAQMGPIQMNIISSSPLTNQPFVSIDSNPPVNIVPNLFLAGLSTQILGTSPVFPGDVRPSFWCLYGPYGTSYILNSGVHDTYEDLMHGSFASATPGDAGDVALTTFIQNGMSGSVPRPEITGNDLRNFIYFIRRTTQQGGAQAVPVAPGASSPDNAPPIILTLSISRTSSTTIRAQWTTDKPTIGLVFGASATQSAFPFYPIFSDLESGYGTTHDLTLTVPAIISPIYTGVLSKDITGNASHSTPLAIS
jgi:hypothetical protein